MSYPKLPLFQVAMPVTPRPESGCYWDVQEGVIFVYILAEDADRAAEKATAIIDQMPYDFHCEAVRVARVDKPCDDKLFREHEESARKFGIAFVFASVATGGDSSALDSLKNLKPPQ